MLQIFPGGKRTVPDMHSLSVVSAADVACCAYRFDALVTGFADVDELCRHTHVIDVAKYVLQGFELLEEGFRFSFGEQRREEFRLIAQFLERLAHLMAFLTAQVIDASCVLG